MVPNDRDQKPNEGRFSDRQGRSPASLFRLGRQSMMNAGIRQILKTRGTVIKATIDYEFAGRKAEMRHPSISVRVSIDARDLQSGARRITELNQLPFCELD